MAVALLSSPAKYRACQGRPIIFTFSNDLPDLLPFKIFAGLPPEHANVADKPFVEVGEVDGNMGLDGVIRVNVSEYLLSYSAIPRAGFQIVPPVAGIDLNLITGYYISFGNTTYDQTTAVKYVLNATIDPDAIDRQPNWQDTGLFRCVKVDPEDDESGNTGMQEKQQRDENGCSATHNNLRWVDNGENLEDCPLPEPDYFTYELYGRVGDKPTACGLDPGESDITLYSDSPTFVVGMILYTDTALTTQTISGFYKIPSTTNYVQTGDGLGNDGKVIEINPC